jgi:hypothetical protein
MYLHFGLACILITPFVCYQYPLTIASLRKKYITLEYFSGKIL